MLRNRPKNIPPFVSLLLVVLGHKSLVTALATNDQGQGTKRWSLGVISKLNTIY